VLCGDGSSQKRYFNEKSKGALMFHVTHNTELGVLELTDDKNPAAPAKMYRAVSGSEADLYEILQSLAATDPNLVISTLESLGQLVQPKLQDEQSSVTTSSSLSLSASFVDKQRSKAYLKNKKRNYKVGGIFYEDDGMLSDVSYEDWESSFGSDLAQLNRQEVDGVMVITARDKDGNILGTFTGNDDSGVSTPL
jgi:hypothetical protein